MNNIKNKRANESPMDKTIPGKYAIIFIMGVGLASAVGSQWYYYHLQQRPLALWGAAEANIMLNAPIVDAVLLAPADKVPPGKLPAGQERERITVGKEHLLVLKRQDVSAASGFSHVRACLATDGSFDWDAPKDDCQPEWQYGLEFNNGETTLMLLFAPNCNRARLVDTGASASMAPVMPGIVRFMKEQLPE
jgi:hypothetical protein